LKLVSEYHRETIKIIEKRFRRPRARTLLLVTTQHGTTVKTGLLRVQNLVRKSYITRLLSNVRTFSIAFVLFRKFSAWTRAFVVTKRPKVGGSVRFANILRFIVAVYVVMYVEMSARGGIVAGRWKFPNNAR